MFAVTAMAMAPAPETNIASSDSGYDVDTARTIEASPSAIAPPTIGPGPTRRWNATLSAASVEPTPDAAIRKPNPDAPTCRTLSASGGTSTWKFIPNVAASPTTVTPSNTSGVLRT